MIKGRAEILRSMRRHFDATLCDAVAGKACGALPVEAAVMPGGVAVRVVVAEMTGVRLDA